MAAIVEISAVETTIHCDEKGNAEQKITIHNTSGRELRLGARVRVDSPGKSEWVGSIVQSDRKKATEWEMGANDTIQLTVPIKAEGAPEGQYGFRVEVYSSDAPGEDYATSNTLAFKVSGKKVEPVNAAKEVKKPFPVWIIAVIVAILVVGVGVAAWLLMRGDKVPDLTGKSLAEAETALQESDLKLGKVTKQVTGNNPVDTVISQDPAADTKIEEGLDAVNIVIEVKPEPEAVPVSVPKLVSMSFDGAKATLEEEELKLGAVMEQFTGSAEGTVLSQKPEAKTKVAKGTTIDLVVEAALISVPNLAGKTPAEGQKILATVSLVPDQQSFFSRGPGTVPLTGTIIAQNPKAEEKVRPETSVVITVKENEANLVRYIRGRENDRECLRKQNLGWDNGNPVIIMECRGVVTENRTWTYDPATGYIHASDNQAKCLQKKYSGWDNGNPIHIWDCNAGPDENKTWIYDAATGYIRGRKNLSKCLHKRDSGWSNGNPIHVWDCDAGPSENKAWFM